MAVKSNSTTTISKEKMAELVEHARSAMNALSNEKVVITQAYNSLKSSEDLQGEEMEAVTVVVENVSKVVGEVVEKFSKVASMTEKLVDIAEGVTKSSKRALSAQQENTAKMKAKVSEAGNK